MSNPENPINPANFLAGHRVRIFLSWATTQDVFVREGMILDPNHEKTGAHGKYPALRLLVERSGVVIRGEPSLEEVKHPFTRSYRYNRISSAEIFEQ